MVGDLGDRVEDMGISVDVERPSGQMAFCRRIEIPVTRHFSPPIFKESIKPDDTSNTHQDCPIPHFQFEISTLGATCHSISSELFKKFSWRS